MACRKASWNWFPRHWGCSFGFLNRWFSQMLLTIAMHSAYNISDRCCIAMFRANVWQRVWYKLKYSQLRPLSSPVGAAFLYMYPLYISLFFLFQYLCPYRYFAFVWFNLSRLIHKFVHTKVGISTVITGIYTVFDHTRVHSNISKWRRAYRWTQWTVV